MIRLNAMTYKLSFLNPINLLRSFRTWVSHMGEHPFPEVHQFLFPSFPITMEYWENCLKVGIERSEEEAAYVLGHKVTRVGIYKERSHPQHEYIVAEVRNQEKKPRFYRLERSVRRKEQAQDSREALSVSAAHTSSSGSSDSSLHLLAKPTSYDTVRMESGRPKEHCTKAIDFRKCATPPTILDLSILGSTLHQDSPNYHLLQRQCYWFAGMFLLALIVDQPGAEVDGEISACKVCVECEKGAEELDPIQDLTRMEPRAPNEVEEFEEEEQTHRHKVLIGGTYWGIRISKPTKKNAKRIQLLALSRWLDILSGVSISHLSKICA